MRCNPRCKMCTTQQSCEEIGGHAEGKSLHNLGRTHYTDCKNLHQPDLLIEKSETGVVMDVSIVVGSRMEETWRLKTRKYSTPENEMKAELREGGERAQPPSPPGRRGPRVTSGRCVAPGPISRESYPTISRPLRPVSAGCRPRRNRSRGDQRRDRGSRVSSARGESDEGSPSRARPFWRRPWVNFSQKKLLSN